MYLNLNMLLLTIAFPAISFYTYLGTPILNLSILLPTKKSSFCFLMLWNLLTPTTYPWVMMKSSVSSFFQCFCNFTRWLEIDGSYNPGQNILGHLRKLSTKIHYCEWTHILPLIRTWECCYRGYFCSPFPLKMFTVNTTPGGEGRENASFCWAIVFVFQEFWPGLLVVILDIWHASSLLLGS